VVSVRGVTMWFGATHALDAVDLDVRQGEILGLVGTNGAGKSTLIKILSGVYAATSGTVEVGGRRVTLTDPISASRAGIETVHQNIDHGVIPGMTVAENLALDSLADGSVPWWASPAAVRRHAEGVAASLGLEVSLGIPVERLSASERQQLIIARALAREPRLLILDEPTSTLSAAESETLFSVVRRLASTGVAVIYISHYLGEVEGLCDRVAVLRDGRLVGTFEHPIARAHLVEAMLGTLVAESRRGRRSGGDPVLQVRGFRAWPGAPMIDFDARRGEVLGITGLIASGKTELLQQVFGLRPIVSGVMLLEGRPAIPADPADAVDAGIAFVPEERGNQAIVPGWSVRQNITLPYLKRYAGFGGLMNRRSERQATRDLGSRIALKYSSPEAPIESLSGGNQQKVIVARWLQGDARLFILDEPFRGIDIGARHDIGVQLRAAAQHSALVVASSDPEEILEVADRILVMAGGGIVGEMSAADATTRTLAQMMSGVTT